MFQHGDIVKHVITGKLATVCSDTVCPLTDQVTLYYAGMPMLSGAYPENLMLVERTGLPW